VEGVEGVDGVEPPGTNGLASGVNFGTKAAALGLNLNLEVALPGCCVGGAALTTNNQLIYTKPFLFVWRNSGYTYQEEEELAAVVAWAAPVERTEVERRKEVASYEE